MIKLAYYDRLSLIIMNLFIMIDCHNYDKFVLIVIDYYNYDKFVPIMIDCH